MSHNDPISTSISHEDGLTVLTITGDIDLATVPAFQAAINEALAEQPEVLIVDLSAVAFLASAGLQALVATHETVSESARFAVVANGPATSRPIQLTSLDQIFAMYPTLPEAVTALKPGG